MMKPPERVEIPEHEELARERFARILALLIVIATLGVATAEFLHSNSDEQADASGVQAQKLSIIREGQLERAADAQRASIDNYALEEQQRTEQANSFQEYLAPSIQQGSPQATQLTLAEDRWSTLADLTGSLTSIKTAGPTSPEGDPRFPNILLSQAEKPSDATFAVEDAFNQLRAAWQGRAGLLSVVLTLFAVGTYLFGLSLSLDIGVRRLLVGLGVVLVSVGVVSLVALQFTRPETTTSLCEIKAASVAECNQSNSDVKAAQAYADGVYALNTFYMKPGTDGLKNADAALTTAISDRPGFAQAYLERAEVRFLMGSPLGSGAVAELASSASLQMEGSDLQRAYDLGLQDKLTLDGIAANRLLLAITQANSGDYGTALTYLNDALSLDPNDPLLYYNKGLALLGQGSTAAAQRAYGDAVAHTIYTNVDAATKRNDATAEEQYVAGALTSLDLLAAHRSDLSGQVSAMKQLIVNGVDHRSAPGSNKASVSNLTLSVFAGQLQWSANIANFDPTTDNVSTQWYYRDPNKLGWSVVPSISGVTTPALDSSAGTQDAYFLLSNYVKATQSCLQPGSYRAELYVDGNLVGSATADGTLPSLTAQPMPDLALSFCADPSWTQDQNNFLRGFSNGYASSDGTSGAYFYVLENPESPAGTSATDEERSWRDELLGSGGVALSVLPKDAGVPSQGNEQTGVNNLGIDNELETDFTYNGGQLTIDVAVTPSGADVAAFVFAPSDQWNAGDDLPLTIFKSIVSTE